MGDYHLYSDETNDIRRGKFLFPILSGPAVKYSVSRTCKILARDIHIHNHREETSPWRCKYFISTVVITCNITSNLLCRETMCVCVCVCVFECTRSLKSVTQFFAHIYCSHWRNTLKMGEEEEVWELRWTDRRAWIHRNRGWVQEGVTIFIVRN